MKTTAFGASSNGLFLFPLRLTREPLTRLLVATIQGDPEYEAIEPQLFDNSIPGGGLRVLMYRKDKKVDVYWQPGVVFNIAEFTLGEGIGVAAETVMSPSRFDITDTGVDIDIAFTDNQGHLVRISIRENCPDLHPVPFLAPVGNEVESPKKLFAVYMKAFDFVKRGGTVIQLTIGDRNLTPATFPIPMNGHRVYFSRYASELVIGEINTNGTEPIIMEQVDHGLNRSGNMHLDIDANQTIPHCWIESGEDTISLRFNPGFPNLLTLPRYGETKGSWHYDVSSVVLFGGTYRLLREEDIVTMELDVTKKWKPGHLPFSIRALTLVIPSFRTWPTTYTWQGTVDLSNNTMVQEGWMRK